ncbi:MAG: QueT transporter family protein [Clostridia bacterium]|nr:QueT transporter family protein [Clostridia bacterium]
MERKKYIQKIIFSSCIAATYAGLTYLSGFFGLAYLGLQFRISEVLTILPVFSPSAIWGLVIGCFLGNIASFNPIDMVFGTLATLISAILTYLLRNIKIKGIPLLSLICPVIINALIISFELSFFFSGASQSFIVYFLTVAVGEAVVCLGLGIPFYILLNKHKEIFDFLSLT